MISFVLLVALILAIVSDVSLLYAFGLFEVLQIITHLPLVNVTATPTRLITFLKPINDLMRFNPGEFFGSASDEVPFNRRFADFGYVSSNFMDNSLPLFAVISGYTVLAIIVLLADFGIRRLRK